jgi:CRISPR-associated protein Cas1
MATLYVCEQGARLEKEQRRLLVVKGDEVLFAAPLARLEQVVLVGNIGVTTPALHQLLQAGIGFSLCDRWGRLTGRLEPASGKNIVLRQRQYARATQGDFCLAVARAIVGGKLRNYRTLARRIGRGHALEEPLIERISGAIVSARLSPDLAALRGVEGAGSRAYFAVLRQALNANLPFAQRTRRPPGDPVNALLSLGYSMLTQNLMTACEVVGLDPYDGFFHSDKYGRPALALDLVEEFRSVIVDSVVLNLVNRRRMNADDFEPGPEGGVYLKQAAMRTYFQAYSARLNSEIAVAGIDHKLSYQKLFEVQARRLRKVIEGEAADYQPFLTR